MYNVSSGFLTAVKQNSRKINAKVIIGMMEIPVEGIIEFTIEESFGANKMPTIGSATSSSLKLKLLNSSITGLILIDTPIRPFVAIEVSGTDEWVPMGVFYADNSDISIDKMTTTIEAFDQMDKLDNITYSSALTFPSTTTAMLQEIQTNYGVDCSTFLSTAVAKGFNAKPEGTVRQVLGLIAMILSKNAMFTRTGQLTFKHINPVTFTIDGHSYIEYDMLSKSPSQITQMRWNVSGEDEDDVVVGNGTGVGLEVSNVGIAHTSQFQSIYDAVYPLNFQAYKMTAQGMPHLEIGDKFTFMNVNGETDSLMICHSKFEYNGGLKSTFEVDFPEKSTQQITTTPSGGATIVDTIKNQSKDLLRAIADSTQQITGNDGGYVVIKPDENNKPEEILIMDTDNINTAVNVWRFNKAGFGHSSTGYNGTYDLAILADGSIVADFITSGTLNAGIIGAGIIKSLDESSFWNLETGEIVLNISSLKIMNKDVALKEDLNSLVTATDVEYYLSNLSTSPSGGSWSTTAPAWVSGKYMFSRTKVTLKSGTIQYRPSASGVNITGATGQTGAEGDDGRGISSISEKYYLSTSATSLVGSTWQDTPQAWVNGRYMWTKSVITYTDNTTSETLPMNATGAQGPQGPQGLQGLEGPQGDQGIEGPKGADGLSSFTHIAYATNSTGTTGFSTSVSLGKTYIGMYVDNIATDSTDPTKYKWSLIKGADGSQGIQGPQGPDGQTSYFHVAYATNSTGTTGFSTTVSAGKTYIGQYTDFTSADSTDPTKYKWTLIKGEQGIQGPKGATGEQGPTGASGVSVTGVVEWYLVSSLATGVTTGTAGWTTTIPTMTVTNKYLWNYEVINFSDGSSQPTLPVVIGVYGNTGNTGATGRSLVSVTEYYLATNVATGVTRSTSGWTTTMQNTTPENKYLWNYEVLTWSVAPITTYVEPIIIGIHGDTGPQGPKGATGSQGPQGATGVGVSGVTEYYLATSASSGVTTATAGWSTTMQTMTVTNKYLWNYEVISFTDGSTQPTIPVIMGVYGNTGSTGATGRALTGVTEYYLATSSATGVTRSTSGWTTAMQTTTPTNKYLWNYEALTWSVAPTTTYVEPIIIGVHGEKGETGAQGPQGIQGPIGPNGQTLYTWVKYADSATGTGMADSPTGKTYIGLAYNKTTATESSTAGDYAWSLIKGEIGPQGPIGPQGNPTYTWVKYADDNLGNGLADSPDGKRFLGLAYNKSTATESTNKADYTWSPLYDNVKVGGRNLVITHDATEHLISTDGSLTESTENRTISDVISVTPNEVLTFSKETSPTASEQYWRYKWMTSAGAFIGRTATTSNLFQWTVPANAYQLQVSYPVESFPQIERGNIATGWSLSPEDLDYELSQRALQGDMVTITDAVDGLIGDMVNKVDVGALSDMQDTYNNLLQQIQVETVQVGNDLVTMEERTSLIETFVDDMKVKWNFIDTSISMAEEGIFIGDNATKMGLLLGTERISFMDKGTEVAYISNKTMRISHGIFVDSAQIGKHKIETIPNTDVTVFTYVG